MIYFANIALFGFKSLDLTGSYREVKLRLHASTVYRTVAESDFVYSDDAFPDNGRVWVKDRWRFHDVVS